jgi:hypothetical protein
MFEFIDGNVIATTARMMRTGDTGTTIIVEGGADKNIYSNFVDCVECQFVIAHGKKNALDATKLLNEEKFERLIAIVDADFWNLDGIEPEYKNIFLTDTHDLETLILKTDIFERIISNLIDFRKAKKYGKSIDKMMLENAFIIGCFKWISSQTKEDLCLNFKDLSYERFIDLDTFEVNLNKLISEVKANSNDYSIKDDEIKKRILELKKCEIDLWQVCSGHDLTKILALGLSRIFGFDKDGALTSEGIEKLLRISYSSSHFSVTQLYKAIANWESINKSAKILKNSAI